MTDSLNGDTLQVQSLNAFWDGRLVLKNVSFSVQRGELWCLTGANGSGKSTLLSALAGIHFPKLKIEGDIKNQPVTIDSVPIERLKRRTLAKNIAYMQQSEVCAWNYTVQDAVLLGRFPHSGGFYTKYDFMVTEEVMEWVQISNLKNRNIAELSGGEWQKVRIARALCQEPHFLLLDEPIANLDFSYQEELLLLFKALAKDRNLGIIVSIHDINTAVRFAHKMLLLPQNPSEPYSGSVSKVMVPDVLEKVYGVQFGIFLHPLYQCPQVYVQNCHSKQLDA